MTMNQCLTHRLCSAFVEMTKQMSLHKNFPCFHVKFYLENSSQPDFNFVQEQDNKVEVGG